MARGKRQLRTRGGAWGQRRVAVGVSMRDLEKASGVNRAVLSLAEAGRYVPTGDEFDRVMTALEAAAEETGRPAGDVHAPAGVPVSSQSSGSA